MVSLKSKFNGLMLFAIALGVFQSYTYKFGGFQLLMTLEQQKKTERVISYLEKDIDKLNRELRSILYDGKKIRKKISLEEAKKKEISKIIKKTSYSFDDLDDCFKSIYFEYGDNRTRKEFDSIKEFRQTLEIQSVNLNQNYLFDLYIESNNAGRKINQLKSLVEAAKIEEENKLKARIKEMSIWQWLFGY